MRYENDDNAVCIDTGIKPVKCKWNMNGTILAVAGYQVMMILEPFLLSF